MLWEPAGPRHWSEWTQCNIYSSTRPLGLPKQYNISLQVPKNLLLEITFWGSAFNDGGQSSIDTFPIIQESLFFEIFITVLSHFVTVIGTEFMELIWNTRIYEDRVFCCFWTCVLLLWSHLRKNELTSPDKHKYRNNTTLLKKKFCIPQENLKIFANTTRRNLSDPSHNTNEY